MRTVIAISVIAAGLAAASPASALCGPGIYRAGCGVVEEHPHHYGVYSSIYGPHAAHRWFYGTRRYYGGWRR